MPTSAVTRLVVVYDSSREALGKCGIGAAAAEQLWLAALGSIGLRRRPRSWPRLAAPSEGVPVAFSWVAGCISSLRAEVIN